MDNQIYEEMKDLEMETGESVNTNLTPPPTPAVTNPPTGTLIEGLNPPPSRTIFFPQISPQVNQHPQSTSSSAQSTNHPRATRNSTAIVNHPRRRDQRQQPPVRRCLLHLVPRCPLCTRSPHNRHPRIMKKFE